MKTIFYALSGEGLGHATRTMSVIERLEDCQVHVFTFGKAHKFFFENYRTDLLHEINGIMFDYHGSRLNVISSLGRLFKFFNSQNKDNIKQICAKAETLKPDLIITDFEPSMARAAHRLKIPLLSIDNQHKFSHCYMGDLPWSLRPYCFVVGMFIHWYIPRPTEVIISTFHYDCERPKKDLTLVNGMMRKSIEDVPVSNEDFVLVYARRSIEIPMMQTINNSWPQVFHVFGSNIRHFDAANVKHYDLSPDFTNHLARCKAVIAPGGNQLISEARFYGKPILTIPEPGQHEQHVNAHYVEKLNLGRRCKLSEFTPSTIHSFLTEFVPNFQPNVAPNGVHRVVDTIKEQLNVRRE